MPRTPRIRLNITTLSKAAALLLVSTTVNAAALTWDTASGDGATITDGGGTWINGGGNWNNAGTDATWNSGTPDSAIFNGTLGGAINVDAGGVTTSGITIGGAQNYTFSGGAIGGNGGLTKNGAGTVTFNNALNTGSGATNINAGTVTFSGGGASTGNAVLVSTTAGSVANYTAGTYSYANYTLSNTADSGTATYNQSGGTNVNVSGTFMLGQYSGGGGASASNIANITGGSLTVGTLWLFKWASSQVNISGTGVVTAGTLDIGWSDGSQPSSINVGNGAIGGTLAWGDLTVRSNRQCTLNLNGGTIKATKNNAAWIPATEFTTMSVQSAGGTIDNGGFNIGIGQVISGTGGLTFDGTGTTTLSGANTYTGTTKINAGTLKLDLSGRSGLISVTSNYNVGASGTLELLSGTNTGADSTLYQNNTFSGAGTIRKTGTGYLGIAHTGSNTNGFSGTYDVQAGILGFNSGTQGSGLATVSLSGATAKLDIRTGTVKIDALNGVVGSQVYTSFNSGNTLSLGNNNGSGTFNGAIVGGTANLILIKNGSGTQTLSGANTYTGATTVNGGVLNLTGSLTSAVTVNSGGALSGTGSTTGNITFNNGSAIVLNAGGAVQGNNVTFAATTNVFVTDAPTGSLVTRDVIRYTGVTSPGVANLSAASNYRSGAYTDDTGNKKITLGYQSEAKTWSSTSGGTWDLNGASSPWSGGSDGKFFWGDSVAFGDTAADQTITLTGNLAPSAITVSNAANTYTFSGSGAIVGSGGLTKNGAGTLIIANTGTNSYTGATNVNAGTLIFRAPSDADWTLPQSAKTVASGATLRLEFQSAPTTFRTTHVGNIVVNSGATLDLNGVSNVIDQAVMNGNGSITGSGNIIKTGTGYVGIFSTTSIKDFSGNIDIQAGCLASNGSDWGSSAGLMNVNVASGAFLDVRTGSVNINQLTGSGHVGSSFQNGSGLTVGNGNGSSVFSGVIENNLTGSSYNVTNGGALNLVKKGTGTLTLSGSGANTYTGGTTISAGTLITGKLSALGAGAVTVSGGTLQIGDGTVNTVTLGTGANLVVTNGSVLKLGALNAASLDSALGVITLAGAGTYSFSTAGKLDLNGVLDGVFASGTHSYTLIAGNASGGGELLLSNISGYNSSLLTLNSFANGTLSFTAVPEPSTYGLIGAGALAAVAFVRRRRKAIA